MKIMIIIIISKRQWGLRERNYQEAGENRIGRRFKTWIFTTRYYGGCNKKEGMST
jgi:hypothetical protein